jgi:hypothetical protein
LAVAAEAAIMATNLLVMERAMIQVVGAIRQA